MDLLQRELARKKEILAKAKEEAGVTPSGSTPKRKHYVKQGDIRRIEEAEEEERQNAAWKRKKKRLKKATEEDAREKESNQEEQHFQSITGAGTPTQAGEAASNQISLNDKSAQEITQHLRSLGLPIRYFAETHEQRVERLQQAMEKESKTLQGLSEMEEFRLGQGHGIRNPFLEKTQSFKQQHLSEKNIKPSAKQDAVGEDENEDHSDDPAKRIYAYFKGLLKQWEKELEERPESVSRSVAGRNESKTLKQCKDYIRPLFKLLKKRTIEPGMQAHLIKIMDYAKEGEFVKAHDAYLDVAIGRAAWPIGVTMVGIHARTGRAKIESSNVAHVMNSELQRKYLTSVKRLLSYAQKIRPDVDPSKKVN